VTCKECGLYHIFQKQFSVNFSRQILSWKHGFHWQLADFFYTHKIRTFIHRHTLQQKSTAAVATPDVFPSKQQRHLHMVEMQVTELHERTCEQSISPQIKHNVGDTESSSLRKRGHEKSAAFAIISLQRNNNRLEIKIVTM